MMTMMPTSIPHNAVDDRAAARHQGAIELVLLYFYGALTSSIFIHHEWLPTKHPCIYWIIFRRCVSHASSASTLREPTSVSLISWIYPEETIVHPDLVLKRLHRIKLLTDADRKQKSQSNFHTLMTRHLFSVYSTSRPRLSSAFCSNLCLYCCNLSNSWAPKWRLHQNNSAQVNTYWSEGWRLLHHVSWLTIGASDSWCLLSFFLPHQTTPVREVEQRRPTVTLNMARSWRGNWVTALHRSP